MLNKLKALRLVLRSALLPSPGERGDFLCLIDFHDHRRGGHFGAWLKQFALQFASLFDRVVVLTPRPLSTASLFCSGQRQCPRNIVFGAIPRFLAEDSRKCDLGRLKALRGGKLHVFVMWGKDLKGRARFHAENFTPWATLMGVSWAERGHENTAAQTEIELIKTFRADKTYCGFLQPDNFLEARHEESVWLPFCETVSLPESTTGQAVAVARHASGRRCIGFIGILTGFRGLAEFLSLAEANPGTAFLAAGQLVQKSVAQAQQRLLEVGVLPNLLILDGFIHDQETLSSIVNSVDAVFIDGRSYPVHSSIVCRALRLGKPVVTTQSDSWTADLVRRWGVGVEYKHGDGDISAALDQWMRENNGDLCRAAADRLSDPLALERCFEVMTQRLKKRGKELDKENDER